MPNSKRLPDDMGRAAPAPPHRTALTVVILVLLAGLFLACLALAEWGPLAGTSGLASTHTPIRIPSSETPADPAAMLVPDTGWQSLHLGLERRLINLFDASGGRDEYLYILRLDPREYHLEVAYSPRPRSLASWQAGSGALVVVNAGYFRVDNGTYLPDGLIVVDGKAIGEGYGDYAGMLAVTRRGAEIRWLAQKPYDPGEALLAAVQSFPLLVKPGGVLGFPSQYEDSRRARRTVVAQDRQGRILFILAPLGTFTLHQLSVTLTGSDLDLDVALNLDGGPSTGLLLADPYEEIQPSPVLPIVILVR
jgi:hypothetical protein